MENEPDNKAFKRRRWKIVALWTLIGIAVDFGFDACGLSGMIAVLPAVLSIYAAAYFIDPVKLKAMDFTDVISVWQIVLMFFAIIIVAALLYNVAHFTMHWV